MTHAGQGQRRQSEYTGGERTICGGGGDSEVCSKNNSTVEISTTTRGAHLPVTQSFPSMCPLHLRVCQGKTD